MEKEKPIQKRTIINRQKIITAAKKLFNTKGYYQTNTKEIAKLAGVSTGSFYNYFPDKLEVFREIINDHLLENSASLLDLINALNERPEQARESMIRYIHDGMDTAYKNLVMFQDYDSLVIAYPELGTTVNAVTNEIMAALHNFCTQSPHVKRRTANPLVMSQMTFFMVQGISIFISKLPDDIDKNEYEEQLAEIAYWYLFGD
ncbi:TetR/AcrR family transcriptional regulator [Acetobacterium woodii]|uniref:Transcriptional regulator TetR family n=1 Tax=Acetobacterium woodii (strain ATCC 29683 / DSM 1030 / JCM 2381 / KCTC 1655 / WB1) TaxID=931626 RepID=H6LB74_ACEWD|nr:TetR/AcrR family transcriptional regulator [Acetobacterium woodii]AFA47626.1 transcriptional regulator TetR family [Acetobacterium woodii DSM 1030]